MPEHRSHYPKRPISAVRRFEKGGIRASTSRQQTSIAFQSREKAAAFETYLKCGSGLQQTALAAEELVAFLHATRCLQRRCCDAPGSAPADPHPRAYQRGPRSELDLLHGYAADSESAAMPALLPQRQFMPEGKVRFAALSPDGTRLFCGDNEGMTTQFALLGTTSGKESYLFSSDRTNFVRRDAGGEHVYLERPDPIGVLAD